jgi:hypothetical protein
MISTEARAEIPVKSYGFVFNFWDGILDADAIQTAQKVIDSYVSGIHVGFGSYHRSETGYLVVWGEGIPIPQKPYDELTPDQREIRDLAANVMNGQPIELPGDILQRLTNNASRVSPQE